MNLAIIPARGGSKRIPGKNIRLFHGKPIIAYSIETARASGLFDKIIVSTEDEQVRAVAKAYGAKIHNRARELADDKTGTQEVMRAAVAWWAANPNCSMPARVCCIYATAPLMLPSDLMAGRAAIGEGGRPYAYSVGGEPCADAGQWYWGHAQAFLQGLPLEGNALKILIPNERVCDINTEEDWQRAERMYQELQERRIEEEARQ